MSRTDHPPDEELARRAARGAADAFAVLVDRYSAKVLNLCYRYTGSYHDAEDIAQEVFVKVFLALPRARLDLPFRPWLYRIAMNAVASHHRRRKRRAQLEDALPAEPALPADEAASPHERAARSELQSALQRAILRLPLDYRAAVVLRYTEGLTFREIGEILRIPEGTAKTNFHRAKPILRDALKRFVETK